MKQLSIALLFLTAGYISQAQPVRETSAQSVTSLMQRLMIGKDLYMPKINTIPTGRPPVLTGGVDSPGAKLYCTLNSKEYTYIGGGVWITSNNTDNLYTSMSGFLSGDTTTTIILTKPGGLKDTLEFKLGTGVGTGGGGTGNIASINGLIDQNQTFSRVNDTNLGLTITSGSGNHQFALSWLGTLADSRIASAANWNDAYANRITTFTTTGNSGNATFSGGILNIPNYTLAGLGGINAVIGTTNKITVTGGNTITIASAYPGQSSINTLGIVTTGEWQGTPIANAYIVGSTNWNAAYSLRIAGLTNTGSGGAPTIISNVLNIPQYAAPENWAYTTLTYGATVTWNLATSNNAKLTLTGNATLAVINATVGKTYTIYVTQDATGGRTLTLPTGSKVPIGVGTGTTINLSTAGSSVDILTMQWDGTNYFFLPALKMQ